jgi:ribulose-5-phosphate 4-epimerase/fuculose-1-phosphate aldolase
MCGKSVPERLPGGRRSLCTQLPCYVSCPTSQKATDMTSNQPETQQARTDLAAALRWIARLGMHEGVCNHFTVMLPERRFLINPKGIGFHRITASNLLVIDEHGKTLEGTGRPPTSGFAIHTRIHLLHPAAKVVLHLHAPYSTALTAIQGGRLQMIHQNAARFFGDIAYDDHFNGIAEATLEGERMATAMGDRKILFLANHGVVVVGPTVAQALDDFYYLERACQVQVLAMQTGQKLNVMPDAMARDTHEQFTRFTVNADLMLEDIKATLDAEEPAYAS